MFNQLFALLKHILLPVDLGAHRLPALKCTLIVPYDFVLAKHRAHIPTSTAFSREILGRKVMNVGRQRNWVCRMITIKATDVNSLAMTVYVSRLQQ